MTIQKKAWKLCYDYLQGSWKQIEPEDMILRQIRYVHHCEVILDRIY